MSKKIAVYAICKNESKFIERFLQTCKDADKIVIADTGSTDDTLQLINKIKRSSDEWDQKIDLHRINIRPWRFDLARNVALSLVGEHIDICVSVDIDELLIPNWRQEIESIWQENTTKILAQLDYKTSVFSTTKIHSRFGYVWKHICHEAIYPDGRTVENPLTIDKVFFIHEPDNSKSRAFYLELLACAAKENPKEPREALYYGRELFFVKDWNKAIEQISRYIALTHWNAEKAYAYRLMGKCYLELNNIEQAEECFLLAYDTDSSRRENSYELCKFYYGQKRWEESYLWGTDALKIVEHRNAWPTEAEAWGANLPDYIAISAYYLGKKDEALEYGKQALKEDLSSERLLNNLKFYESL